MAWVEVANDQFNRLENPLSDSGKWVRLYYSPGPTILPALRANNTAAVTTVAGFGCAVRTGETYTDNQRVVSIDSGTSGLGSLYLALRHTNPNLDTNGYFAFWNSTSSPSPHALYKWNNGGTSTQLGSNNNHDFTGSQIELTAVGTTVTSYTGGTQKIQQTDSTWSTGYPALYQNASAPSVGFNYYYGYSEEVAGQPLMARWGGVPYMTLGRRKW